MADERRKAGDEAEDAPEPRAAARDAQRETAREQREEKSDEPSFPRERLMGDDAYTLTGYEGHVVAGALHGIDKKNLTISEVKAACQAWLSAEVKEA